MTRKLKRRVKNAILKTITTVTGVVTIGYLGFVSSGVDARNIDLGELLSTSVVEIASNKISTLADQNENGGTKVTIAADGAIVCDSLVQGIRDCNLTDGDYIFRVVGNINGTQETKDYPVELINYYDNVTYSLDAGQTSKTVSLGDSTTAYKMLAVKYHKNLSVDAGVTLTANMVNNLTYKKGMYICVLGNIENHGTISMTARGTYNIAGENVYLWKNMNNSYEYVPARGATGGAAKGTSAGGAVLNGNPGNAGSNRQTGGGGTGGGRNWSRSIRIGAGGTGTSYSGGAGSGAANSDGGGGGYAASGDGSSVGGAGSKGIVRSSNGSGYAQISLGGAGNPSGGYECYRCGPTNYVDRRGTGGLLVMYADNLYNSGEISAMGVQAPSSGTSNGYGRVDPGGSSGGGSINIFANKVYNNNTITAAGGKATVIHSAGGKGGDGSVTIKELGPDMICEAKSLILKINEGHTIKTEKIQIIDNNTSQIKKPNKADLVFSSLDSSVATVDSTGRIKAVAEGRTRIKVTDTKNKVDTYIYVQVVQQVRKDMHESKGFTIALKENGTVWSYGLNDKGQLGLGDTENRDEPTQVTSIKDIKQLATGYSHTVALAQDGSIYTWGVGTSGQLGTGTEENKNIPVKISGLKNIKKVGAYKNISLALDNDGYVYVWGQGYSSLPMKLIFQEKVADISGTLVLSRNGYVYSHSNLETPIPGLVNIAKISAGDSHYLALDTMGVLYAWGNNTKGECGTTQTGNISVREVDFGVCDISAGNAYTIYQKEDEGIYVLGDNSSGQIGLNTTASTATPTQIILPDGSRVFSIAAGEGTHSGLVDINGFVWQAGSNTYGELGMPGVTTQKTYAKVGGTALKVNQPDDLHLDKDRTTNIKCKLEIGFNLKIDNVDENQDNFDVTLSNNNVAVLHGKALTTRQYGKTTITITHKPTGITKTINLTVMMQMESLVQGVRDTNLPDGDYDVDINGKIYRIELHNYYDDMTYSLADGETSKTVELGDDTTEYKTLVVKYHKNLTVEEGVKLTAKTIDKLTYKKGMYVCVLGNIYNQGEISMTARGTYNVEGEDVYLWKNIDNTYEYVPALGAEGGASQYTSAHNWVLNGKPGTAGAGRQTGGGGTGAGRNWTSAIRIGAGGRGTSYSGGSGSGASNSDGGGGWYAESAAGSSIGGPGSTGIVHSSNGSNYGQISIGGTGNKSGGYQTYKVNPVNYVEKTGTGGLLIMYADYLYNDGSITANGVGSSTASPSKGYARVDPGGSSGGGSINIFAKRVMNYEDINSNGGEATRLYSVGGAGGNGTVTINELGYVLNSPEKRVTLRNNTTHQIDRSRLWYVKLNNIQTEDIALHEVGYEVVGNDGIISVDSQGKVTALKAGTAKVKITDTERGNSTYIIFDVIDDVAKGQIKEGTDFTIALKQDGTVWSYGKNDKGQLGNGTQIDSNIPVQVIKEDGTPLENIVQIGAKETCGIALDANGDVYTWGTTIIMQGQSKLVATKSTVVSNIKKIEASEKHFYAINKAGNAYIWGEVYAEPTRIEVDLIAVDLAGDLLLGENGRVYKAEQPEKPLPYLFNIVAMSQGDNHYLFMTADGLVYSIEKGKLGQLGNGKTKDADKPVLVKTGKNQYLQDVINIAAGNENSMAITMDGTAYAWGDNQYSKLGIDVGDKITYATKITKAQDKEGNEINLGKIEIVETGKKHSSISDEKGFVYSVGANHAGKLGTGDNIDRNIFTRIGELEIATNPKQMNLPVHTSQNIAVFLSNGFNLKTDIAEKAGITVINTNEKVAGLNEKATVNFVQNYEVTGNKIGRVCFVATSEDGHSKNIWINVVENLGSTDVSEVPAKVVNGESFTLALRSDGTVWSFGNNEKGSLGNESLSLQNTPSKLELPEKIIDISSGRYHSLLLGKSGKVYTFGANHIAQLGIGNMTSTKKIQTLNLSNITKVVASENSSFAIDKNGKVYAWGEKFSKTPNLLTLQKTVEETIEENGKEKVVEKQVDLNIIDISKNYYLADDGIVRKLEDNKEIKLSLNEYDPAKEPVLIEERVVQIAEGVDHLLLLGKSGRVFSYGRNVYGQLGDKTTVGRQKNITTVVRVEDGSILTNISEISAGDKYSMAVSQDGKVYTFGINKYEQLGISNELETGGKQEIGYAYLSEVIYNVERVSCGYNHTAVYKEDGEVYTWGSGELGQLGNGTFFNNYEPQLVGGNEVEVNKMELLLEEGDTTNVEGIVNYFNLFTEKEAEISYEVADKNFAVISSKTGEVMAIKEGRTTIVVRDVNNNKMAFIPLRILAKGTKSDKVDILIEPQVETSGSHTITLKVDGTVWCYGKGLHGEMGTGKEGISDEPVQAIFPKGTIITKIAAGEDHCLALDSNGNVWSWGRNHYSQLGNTKEEQLLVPTIVPDLKDIVKIACGANNSFAIGKSGEVYSFGFNTNGEGGIKSYNSKLGVKQVTNITGAIDIKAGRNHTIILRRTGEVYTAGSNLYGELGRGDANLRKSNQFTKVPDLETVVAITAGDSHNSVIKLDGTVWAWGSNLYRGLGIGENTNVIRKPAKVPNLSDISYISGGKGNTVAINKNNEVYVVGLNTLGELGNNTKTNVSTYTKLDTIEDVIEVSSGTTYTTFLKRDGSVWASGDYSHGDIDIRSKTKAIVPVQVGNDETGLEQTEITVKVGESKDIVANCSYEFNLIHLEENFAETLEYSSWKEEIAGVNEKGIVTGNRIGTTRVTATSNETGKKYSVLVHVIGEKNIVAPKIEAGENFAAALKADGSVWTFGYNVDGVLAIGNNLTKTIPNKTNILSTYADVKAGNNFMIALRADGTIWSVGNNMQGQLGSGNTKSKNKLSEINGIQDITKIAAGKNYALAIDKNGIVYEWGNGILKPTPTQKVTQRVLDLDIGEDQSAFVTAKGTIVGYGSILTGEAKGMQNAVKVQVAKDKLIILDVEGKCYEYQNGNVTQIALPEKVVDIRANGETVMYQTADEKTYVVGENKNGELGTGDKIARTTPTLVNKNGENTYGIGVGSNNTYIIQNTGNVYAAGANTYGSIGNGTRTEELEHTLVGDRKFEVKPITATMKEGDIENVDIQGNAFNVFGDTKMSPTEYEWESDDPSIVLAEVGKLTAMAEGTAHITITDKVTKAKVELTRLILAQEKDRIAKITVNGEAAVLDEASTEDNLIYRVTVVTNENNGNLQITTNNLDDRISIDDGANWSYNGTYNGTIDLPDKITEKTITVGIKNNDGDYPLELTYTLIVEKITDDIGIKQITATETDASKNQNTVYAIATGLTRYEVVVEENTTLSLVDVLANSEYSFVSIEGEEYTINEQNKEITIGKDLSQEVKIAVKSEAGREAEYTLVIYTKKKVAELISLTVNGKEATKTSEGTYAITVDSNITIADIKAEVESNLVQVSIEDNTYKAKSNTNQVELKENLSFVSVKTKTMEGEIKEYTLSIYKEEENENEVKLDMLLVNGVTVLPEKDGKTYITYLPSADVEAVIKAIAKEEDTSVQIADGVPEIKQSEKTVSTLNAQNTYTVTLTNPQGNTSEYTVIIRKAEADTSLKEVIVSKGDTNYDVTKIDATNYVAKIPADLDKVDVTAITGYIKSKVQVNETGNYLIHEDKQEIMVTGNPTIVKIKVESEDGTRQEEYTLTIEPMSSNANLEQVTVDGTDAILKDDGKYHYTLLDSKEKVTVYAKTDAKAPEKAWVNISGGDYALYQTTKLVDITAREMEVPIKVRAEDGSLKEYILVIEGLPDDTTIRNVTVNGKTAKYIEGQNRYEVRCDDASLNVEVVLNDLLASMELGTNSKAIGTDTITVAKTGEETLVTVKVTSQSGLEHETYTIAILDASKNANLDIVKVNGETVAVSEDGTYYIGVKQDITNLNVVAIAEDETAITGIESTLGMSLTEITNKTGYTAEVSQAVVEGTNTYEYDITVTAESGNTKTYKLTVEILEGNNNILKVLAGETADVLNEAQLKDDGNYYYRIGNVNETYVKVVAESSKATVKVNGKTDEIVTVETIGEVTTVPIEVTAEDGSIKKTNLIITKKNADTTVKSITGDHVLKVEIEDDVAYVYVDEDINSEDLTITLNNEYASLKLEAETDYTLSKITRTIPLASTSTEATLVNLAILAEDGTAKEYMISILREPNLKLLSVEVNTENIPYNEESQSYEALVPGANKPQVVITAENSKQTVQLLDKDGKVLKTGTGSITTNLTLSTTNFTDNYKIKVISHHGVTSGSMEYDFNISQKSRETGITYVKVDELGTILSADKLTYSSTVAGKENYPVEIKLKDEKAKVKVLDKDGNVLIDWQTGTLTGNLAIPDGEIKVFTMVVESESGEQKNYYLSIERVSSRLDIASITVTDYDATGSTLITKPVTTYDPQTKTYRVKVDTSLSSTKVVIQTVSNQTIIATDANTSAKGKLEFNQALSGSGVEVVNIEITAPDGTHETRYLEILQVSSNIGILSVQVDGIEAKQTDSGDYEATVKDKPEFANVKVVLQEVSSMVSLNGQNENNGQTELQVEKADNKKVVVTIKVTASDGSKCNYQLTINIISSNSEVQKVIVDGKEATATTDIPEGLDGKYIAYFDKTATIANATVIAKVEEATVSHEEPDGSLKSALSKLDFSIDTSDLTQNSFKTTFKVIAEDGTEKQYELECIRNSDDSTIKQVQVQDEVVMPNVGHKLYADGTYYKIVEEENAKIRIETNSPFAKIAFDGKEAKGVLEHEVALDAQKRITQIPVTITSQQGNTYETIIYIERISNNCELLSAKVNSVEAEKKGENTYLGAIEDIVKNAKIELSTQDENATIIRTMENGDPWLDENGTEVKGQRKLVFDADTPDDVNKIYFKVVAENGKEKNYVLQIDRKPSDLSIKEITVTDYDVDGKTIITKPVTLYDEQTKTYKMVVHKDLKVSDVTVSTTIDYENITLDSIKTGKGTVTLPKALTGLGSHIVTIEVTGIDGNKETRYLELIQLSDEIGILKVEVDGKVIPAKDDGNYETTITDKEKQVNTTVTLKGEKSRVSIKGLNEAVKQTSLNVFKGANRQIILPIKVTAEDGTSRTYNLTLNIISSNSNVQKVTADGVKADLVTDTPEGLDGKYTVYIDAYAMQTTIMIRAESEYATVSQEELGLSSLDKLTFNLETKDLTQKVYTVPFKVTAEDGTVKNYELECVRKSDDASIKEVYILDELVEPNLGNPEYADGTYYYETTRAKAKIKVITNHELATVSFSGKSAQHVLENTVELDPKVKTIAVPVTVTSQQGTTYETTIYVKRISNNYDLKSVKVDGENVEKKEEENTFLGYIYSSQETAKLEIEAVDNYATIVRTVENGDPWLDENGVGQKGVHVLNVNVKTPDDSNVIYFKIVAENGEESPIYKLYIDKMSDDNTLKEIYVNGKLIEPNEDGEYITSVLDTEGKPIVTAITNHELAHVRIQLGEESLHTAEEEVTLSNYKQTEVPITVRSQSGLTNVVTLYINRIATSIKLDSVTLDDRQPDSYNENSHTYTFIVDHGKEDYELFVLAESDYTYLEFEDQEYQASFTEIVNLPEEEEGKSFKVKAKSEAGIEQEYTIDVVHASDNTNIKYLKVNDEYVYPEENDPDSYIVTIPKDAISTLFELETENGYAHIQLGDNQIVKQYEKGALDCNLQDKEIIVAITITAADGKTVRTINVTLTREPGIYIIGKITTENVNGVHEAEVNVYEVTENTGQTLVENSFIGEDGKVRTKVAKADTKSNGSYKILMARPDEEGNYDEDILKANYEVVVTKPGYLSYTVTDVKLKADEVSKIEDYKLIAGDTVETGEIEIDDLVDINENYGLAVDYSEGVNDANAKYDFNGDGAVDNIDRDILKKNYGKKAEKVKWVDPEEAILPLECKYTITSSYGVRIHPITKEEHKHTGIDIAGEHHAKVLAVADGEVTWSGVQNGYGNCIEVKHVVNGETIYSFYAHLSEIKVQKGQKVLQGETIALEGGDPNSDPNPGNSTGHHLHFEIRTKSGYGNDVDPNKYIKF